MIYGHGDTIHQTNHLDIEVDAEGNVKAVWFRCMMLPFQVSVSDCELPEATTKLIAVEIQD